MNNDVGLEGVGLRRVGRHEAGYPLRLGRDRRQRLEAPCPRPVDQVLAVAVQAVEQEHRQGQRFAHVGDVARRGRGLDVRTRSLAPG